MTYAHDSGNPTTLSWPSALPTSWPEAPLKLWELAEQLLGVTRGRRRDQYAEELDRVVLRNPFAFMFTPGRDGD